VRTLHEIVEEIWQNRDTAYNVGCLAKRLQRMDKALTGEDREALASRGTARARARRSRPCGRL
jgi:hypothetical protein